VNAPRSWPNISLSSSSSGMAPQCTGTKRPVPRRESLCSAAATSSFPVPLSPEIRTVASVAGHPPDDLEDRHHARVLADDSEKARFPLRRFHHAHQTPLQEVTARTRRVLQQEPNQAARRHRIDGDRVRRTSRKLLANLTFPGPALSQT
jgi:hypothetical protein